MKIEFNGRVVAGVFLGAVCGAVVVVAISAGPVGRIQAQRDDARATVQAQKEQIQQLQAAATAYQQRLTAAPQIPQDPAVQVLNAVHPGLGTLAVAADKAIKANQTQRVVAVPECPPGSSLQTGPWQGLKCVAVDPQ